MSQAISVSRQVLVLGATPEAQRVACELHQLGYAVHWVSLDGGTIPQESPNSTYPSPRSGVSLIAFEGQAGHFQATLQGDREISLLPVAAAVIAVGNERYYPAERYGISLGPRVITVSQLLAQLDESSEKETSLGNRVIVLLDWGGETPRETATEALWAASRARCEAGVEVYVFYENLKVDSPGLERQTRQMRDQGILFCRYSEAKVSADESHVMVSYMEGDIQGDLLVLPEAIRPHPATANLAKVFDIRLGEDGLFQEINVRQYRPGLSSRRGVFVAGRCHMDASLEEAQEDALQAAANVDALLGTGVIETEEIIAHVDAAKCIRCLTCVRTCPHTAIGIADYEDVVAARVMDFACYGCGACVANCPVQAIALVGESPEISPAPAWMTV